MMTLITGGSKCGKSALGEALLENLPEKVYIATMIPYGEEAMAAIARHRRNRAAKGFRTIEQYTDLNKVHAAGANVLLECLGNLCANELFRTDMPTETDQKEIHRMPGEPDENAPFLPEDVQGKMLRPEPAQTKRRTVDKTAYDIIEGIRSLQKQADRLVIVTNQVGADGAAYEEGTMDYIRLLGVVNRSAAQMADFVIECVYGIPVIIKGDVRAFPYPSAAGEREVNAEA